MKTIAKFKGINKDFIKYLAIQKEILNTLKQQGYSNSNINIVFGIETEFGQIEKLAKSI